MKLRLSRFLQVRLPVNSECGQVENKVGSLSLGEQKRPWVEIARQLVVE